MKGWKIWGIMAVIFAIFAFFCLSWQPIIFGTAFLGALCVGCTGEAIMIYNSEKHPIFRRIAKLGVILFSLFIISFILIQSLILSGEKADNEAYEADYVLVLGARIYNDRPSESLKSRLDTAISVYEKNPDIILIVCGGQGSDEIMPEAHMMRSYLLENGVPDENILVEDQSHNTIDNIAFARDLYDLENYNVAVITSEFHLARARRLMKQAGLTTYGIPAQTPYLSLRIVSHMREYCSTFGLIITGRYF